MIQFNRYPHVNDLIFYYVKKINDKDVLTIYENGVQSENDAKVFSKFIWVMVDMIHADEEAGNNVLGNTDNTDMLPDLSYEITNYMRKNGYFHIWSQVSDC